MKSAPFLWMALLLGLCLIGANCARQTKSPSTAAAPPEPPPSAVAQSPPATSESATDFVLTSSAFAEGQPIPVQYTADGADQSPPLSWRGEPRKAEELVLIVEDPDAPGGDFVHWIVYNIPPHIHELPAGIPAEARPQGLEPIMQGRNDFGTMGYRGPAPPPGRVHHYRFRLIALDAPSGLDPGADKTAFRETVEEHFLAEAQLTGTYQR